MTLRIASELTEADIRAAHVVYLDHQGKRELLGDVKGANVLSHHPDSEPKLYHSLTVLAKTEAEAQAVRDLARKFLRAK